MSFKINSFRFGGRKELILTHLATKKRCRDCGSFNIVRKGVDCGYTSASELGRPAGAKGRDEFAVAEFCGDCESGNFAHTPVPCHVCGFDAWFSDEGLTGVDIAGRCHGLTGIHDWVPGLPNDVNICGCSECSAALDKEIIRLVEETLDDGGFE